MRFLIVVANGFEERAWLKENGFRFARPNWVKPSEDEAECDRVRAYARGKFEVSRHIDPASVPPPVHPAKPSVPEPPRRDQFYTEGQAKHREPKPYARRIAEPLGGRDDFKRDSARNWSRARQPKD